MKTLALLGKFEHPRVALVIASWFYAYAIHYSHMVYLNPVWEYYGFTYKAIGVSELALMIFLVTLASLMLPSTLTRASSIVALMLFLVVYIPTVVISLSLDVNRLDRYGFSLRMLGLAFVALCLGSKQKLNETQRLALVPDDKFEKLIFYFWILCCIVLIYNYASIMRFAGLDEIYQQRAAGTSTGLFMGYTQTYFSNVLSPALIAIGLTRSKLWPVLIGSIGCLIIFMINAQRTVFLLPFAIIGLNFLLKSRISFLRTSAFPTFLVAAGIMLSSAFYMKNIVASFLSAFLVFRTLGLPGLTFSQYYDVFSSGGFTWWSHVKGLDLLIAPPPFFASHPSWPGLGYIVGDRFYGNIENNANANLFSGDGVAAAGALGVIVIGIILASVLFMLDRATRGWDRHFSILVMLPVSLSLTNGHLFTTMLSFGGLFWLLTFYFYKPRAIRVHRGARSAPMPVGKGPH